MLVQPCLEFCFIPHWKVLYIQENVFQNKKENNKNELIIFLKALSQSKERFLKNLACFNEELLYRSFADQMYQPTAVQILFHRVWMLQFANVHFAFHDIHKTSLRFGTFTKLPFLNFASEHMAWFSHF